MLNSLWEHLEEVKELVKDYFDGMSSKDKVTAGGIIAIAGITIANIVLGGKDDSAGNLPDARDEGADEDDA